MCECHAPVPGMRRNVETWQYKWDHGLIPPGEEEEACEGSLACLEDYWVAARPRLDQVGIPHTHSITLSVHPTDEQSAGAT